MREVTVVIRGINPSASQHFRAVKGPDDAPVTPKDRVHSGAADAVQCQCRVSTQPGTAISILSVPLNARGVLTSTPRLRSVSCPCDALVFAVLTCAPLLMQSVTIVGAPTVWARWAN